MVTAQLLNAFILLIFVVTSASTVMLIATKYKLWEKYETNRPAKWPRMCYLCVGFWVSYLLTPLLNYLLGATVSELGWIILAFASASLVRKLTSDVIV